MSHLGIVESVDGIAIVAFRTNKYLSWAAEAKACRKKNGRTVDKPFLELMIFWRREQPYFRDIHSDWWISSLREEINTTFTRDDPTIIGWNLGLSYQLKITTLHPLKDIAFERVIPSATHPTMGILAFMRKPWKDARQNNEWELFNACAVGAYLSSDVWEQPFYFKCGLAELN